MSEGQSTSQEAGGQALSARPAQSGDHGLAGSETCLERKRPVPWPHLLAPSVALTSPCRLSSLPEQNSVFVTPLVSGLVKDICCLWK